MHTKFPIAPKAALLILTTIFLVSVVHAASREAVFVSLNGKDGTRIQSGLIFDSAGNLYGTTGIGGAGDSGTVFELTPNGQGGWTEHVLHSFVHNFHGGENPDAGVIMDAAGNLYGTTYAGGYDDAGTVFELSPVSGGGWTETILYQFSGTDDGETPTGNLIFDAAGNLYSTTVLGGINGVGTVFELSPNGNGGWTEQVLYSFVNNGKDGYEPYAGVTFDAAGNLYGTTFTGGIYYYGAVFELKRTSGGAWEEGVLHSFNNNGTDGYYAYTGVVLDAAGNVYGTTLQGGAYNYGIVFGLQRTKEGGWAEAVLHSFNDNGTDGYSPYANLIFDALGNLYGTTEYGGIYKNGTVFELRP